MKKTSMPSLNRLNAGESLIKKVWEQSHTMHNQGIIKSSKSLQKNTLPANKTKK